MTATGRGAGVLAVVVLSLGAIAQQAHAQSNDAALEPFRPERLTADDYRRAASFLDAQVKNPRVQPHWFNSGETFWYRRDVDGGYDFQRVDARQRRRVALFDAARLSAEMARVSGKTFAALKLPLQEFSVVGNAIVLKFVAQGLAWTCELPGYRCSTQAALAADVLASPDGRYAVFRRARNLWLKNLSTGEERALTTDGEQYNEYGWVHGNGQNYVRLELTADRTPPIVIWSPDSKYVLTHRIDERALPETYLLQAAPPGSVRARVHAYRQSIPGEPYPEISYTIFDIEGKARIDVGALPNPRARDAALDMGWVWWAPSSRKLYLVSHDQYFRSVQLCEVDARTGRIRPVLGESSATPIALTGSTMSNHGLSAFVLEESNEVIWPSERDGWMHLYLFDLSSGRLKRRLTSGEWVVHGPISIDKKKRVALVIASGREPGRDPYSRHLYAVSLDRSEVRLLTPEDADHELFGGRFNHGPALADPEYAPKTSPNGEFFVDTFSRVDTVPVSVLRSTRDPSWSMPLERADAGALLPADFRWPELFTAKGDDGATDIYGTVFLPAHFDARRKYPVIDFIYASPLYTSPDVASFNSASFAQRLAFAQLGFIGVNINGRGSTGRSKTFRDFSYGKIQDGPGIADHVSAIRQLARKMPQLDLDRVGVTGFSFGGYNTPLAMMLYPELYKVGVSGAGAMDLRGLGAQVLDKYQGEPGPNGERHAAVAIKQLAPRFKGKLLMVYGDMDENVNPAVVLQYADALVQANKDFDILPLANYPHTFLYDPYYVRRQIDYFVRHLMGSEPPESFSFAAKP